MILSAAARIYESSGNVLAAADTNRKLAALDPRPQLPDAAQAPCPRGSGLTARFTVDQDIVRQRRFKILHDDRDYCRDAYDRVVKRVSQ